VLVACGRFGFGGFCLRRFRAVRAGGPVLVAAGRLRLCLLVFLVVVAAFGMLVLLSFV